MINNILTLDDLQTERMLVRARLKEIELSIRGDIRVIETSVKPAIHEMVSEKKESPGNPELVNNLIGLTASLGLDLFLTRVVMKNSSPLKRGIVSVIVQTSVPVLVGNTPLKLISIIKRIVAHRG